MSKRSSKRLATLRFAIRNLCWGQSRRETANRAQPHRGARLKRILKHPAQEQPGVAFQLQQLQLEHLAFKLCPCQRQLLVDGLDAVRALLGVERGSVKRRTVQPLKRRRKRLHDRWAISPSADRASPHKRCLQARQYHRIIATGKERALVAVSRRRAGHGHGHGHGGSAAMGERALAVGVVEPQVAAQAGAHRGGHGDVRGVKACAVRPLQLSQALVRRRCSRPNVNLHVGAVRFQQLERPRYSGRHCGNGRTGGCSG